MRDAVEIDVAVFGGGIAGLWLLNRLRSLGYDALLFEKTALGSGQTIASQGIIHSGVKYAFDGVNRPQTEALSAMPRIWMDCIEGRGEVDLRGTEILASHQLMFTTGGLVSRIAGTFATMALRSGVKSVERFQYPPAFSTPDFSGKVYQLDEPVLETKTLVRTLRERFVRSIYHSAIAQVQRRGDTVTEIRLGEITVRPGAVFLTAGLGNEWFAEQLGADKNKTTQRRPLRMFLARGVKHQLFAHCLVPEPKPRVTITTHMLYPDEPGLNTEYVWYLGGNIAEKAAGMSEREAFRWAHSEMTDVFPWLDWKGVRWAIHDVDRAEPAASKLLPSGPTLTIIGNAALAWPTKLALAPALAHQAVRWLEQQGVAPSHKSTELPLPLSKVALYPWEEKREWIQI